MTQTVADVIIETLAEAGASRCYGVPGDTLNYITDAIRRHPAMRWVHVRHEEAGGFAAGADALLTGELALCAGSCGPGSLHFVNGLFDAHRSRAPVVLIASQIAQGEIGSGFPQEVDYRSVYATGSVWCEEVRTPANARRMAAAAAQTALSRKGVSVLILSADVSSQKAPTQPAFATHRANPRTIPDREELRRLSEALNAPGTVAIYGGSGCATARDQVLALAERLNAPIAYTSRAKDFLEYDNPYAVGMTGVFGVESGYQALMRCDTLLLLGCDFAWRQFYPDKARIVQVDLDGTHLGHRHPVDLGLVGDVASTIDAVLPDVAARSDGAFLDRMRELHQKAYAALDRKAVANEGAIHPQYLVDLLARHAAPDAIWTADGGSPMVWLLRHVPATGRSRTVVSLTHGTMANAMPNALGAQASHPDRQVISLSGDGGIAMLLGDLLTTIQEKLPIKVVVFNNASLAFVELEQKVEGLHDAYTNLVNPDFGRVAEAIGMWGRHVDHAQDLEAAVKAFLAADGPALLDVAVSRVELVMPAHIEPSQVLGTSLYSAKALLSGRARDVVELVADNFLKR